ncbi:Slc8a3 [Symbiodinium microadriaticum]|nr:Slc8a3 [Symbiodinium microadriaticum]
MTDRDLSQVHHYLTAGYNRPEADFAPVPYGCLLACRALTGSGSPAWVAGNWAKLALDRVPTRISSLRPRFYIVLHRSGHACSAFVLQSGRHFKEAVGFESAATVCQEFASLAEVDLLSPLVATPLIDELLTAARAAQQAQPGKKASPKKNVTTADLAQQMSLLTSPQLVEQLTLAKERQETLEKQIGAGGQSVGPAFHVSASPAYDFAVDHSFEWAVHWPQPRKIKTLLLAPPRVGIESGARAGDSPLPLTGPRAALLLRARGCSTPVVLDRSPFAAKASRVASTFVHGRHFLQHLLLCQCFWGALLQGLKFLVFGIDVSGLAAVVSLPWHPAVQLIGQVEPVTQKRRNKLLQVIDAVASKEPALRRSFFRPSHRQLWGWPRFECTLALTWGAVMRWSDMLAQRWTLHGFGGAVKERARQFTRLPAIAVTLAANRPERAGEGKVARWLEQLGRAEAQKALLMVNAAASFAIYEKSIAQSVPREDLASLLGTRSRPVVVSANSPAHGFQAAEPSGDVERRRGAGASPRKAEIASMQQEQQALEARLKELRKQREDLANQLKVVDEQIDVACDTAKPAKCNHSVSRELHFANVHLAALAAQRASAERERQVKASAQRVAGELQRELSIEEARVHAVN